MPKNAALRGPSLKNTLKRKTHPVTMSFIDRFKSFFNPPSKPTTPEATRATGAPKLRPCVQGTGANSPKPIAKQAQAQESWLDKAQSFFKGLFDRKGEKGVSNKVALAKNALDKKAFNLPTQPLTPSDEEGSDELMDFEPKREPKEIIETYKFDKNPDKRAALLSELTESILNKTYEKDANNYEPAFIATYSKMLTGEEKQAFPKGTMMHELQGLIQTLNVEDREPVAKAILEKVLNHNKPPQNP
jgi:hypothetical protein